MASRRCGLGERAVVSVACDDQDNVRPGQTIAFTVAAGHVS
jgi:hypothetical protein